MPAELPAGGIYQINLRVARSVSIQIGKLGRFRFTPGTYIYTGRAKRGLKARLERHRRKDKPLRWHIDYLTSHPEVAIERIEIVSEDFEAECVENQKLLRKRGVSAPVKGFEASDCRAGCPAHLAKIDGGA